MKLTAIRERGKMLGWVGQIDENTWAAACLSLSFVGLRTTTWNRDLPSKTAAKQWLRKMNGIITRKRK